MPPVAQRAGTGELHLARLLCVPAPASGLAALNVSKEERGQAGVSSALRCFWRPAGLLVRALETTARIQPGFATDHRMYIRLVTPQPDFTPDTRLFTRLLSETRVLPGVTDATLS